MQDEVVVFSDVFLPCSLSIKLVLSISMSLKRPPPTQLKTTTVRPIYPDTCPFNY